MEQLIAKLSQHGLIDEMGNIILETYENDSYQSVDKDTFLSFFGATNFTYTALKAADQGKGYTRFFDNWKALGIL